MSGYSLTIFYALLLLLFHSSRLEASLKSGKPKCREREKEALLNFKQSLIDYYHMLPTWTDHHNNTDCCKWKGIQCNNVTALVEVLDLRCLDGRHLRGNINLTSLIHLQNIQHLDLSNNYFTWVHIPQLIGSFTNLTYLNLSSSGFGGTIPSQLGYLSQLRYLDLGINHLWGPIPFQIGNLKHLQYLDLGHNALSGQITFQIGNLKQLRYLNLGSTTLYGEIPFQIGNLQQLQYLNLGSNTLYGAIPFRIGNLPLLHTLRLGGNFNIRAKDAEWLSNLYSLINLDLSSLHNIGSSPQWLQTISDHIPNLRELRLELHLSDNKIALSAPLYPNFLSLKILDLSYNNLPSSIFQGSIPDEFGKGMNSLEDLDLSVNKLQGEIPTFFGNMCTLQKLNLSQNNLSGQISSFIQNSSWCNRHIFQSLDLSYNQITGVLPKSIGLLSELEFLSLAGNSLEGEVNELHLTNFSKPIIILNSNQFENRLPTFLLRASELFLSENKFSDLFSFLCGEQSTAPSLATLDLSSNQIKGQLPDCWKSVDSLLFLDLSNNKLSGKIPTSIGSLVKLEALVLRNNSLTGQLPSTLKNCSNLIMLDVGENMLSGPIPSWIGETMQQLIILIMRGNHFSGNLPIQLCYLRSIQLLDLSRNKLSKGIPICLKNFTAMSEKSINGTETQTREIPTEVEYLLGLVSLNLSRNNLSGEIPSEIGYLSSLESLDLSRNHFSGRIPSSLSQIDSLGKLDLSHNSLSGRIPTGRHLETFDASSFEGNVDLCGEQLNKTCPGDETTVKPLEAAVYGEGSVFYEALYMSLGIGFFVGFWGFVGSILIWQAWRIAYLRFLNRLTARLAACMSSMISYPCLSVSDNGGALTPTNGGFRKDVIRKRSVSEACLVY
ncbi:LRR receptor-like serine/threonine-protein kinase GSO1, partial [Mucuna pruriens]